MLEIAQLHHFAHCAVALHALACDGILYLCPGAARVNLVLLLKQALVTPREIRKFGEICIKFEKD